MQKACEANPSAMAAVLALADDVAEKICAEITSETGELVVPANYNCPGQLVISGSNKGIDLACDRLKAAGAKRALKLPVGGAFHSPLMAPAKEELEQAILATNFHRPNCPVYQNVVAKAVTDPEEIKQNLIDQLTGPVRWTQTIESMIADGASTFTEVGPGKVLQGLINKINKAVPVESLN
jgi:[acyl-carrier-protein] S-malonyltransferase